MTPDDPYPLITRAIDGELSPADARTLRRLLAESADAARLYARLKRDADRLRRLPKLAPPADLHARVMARLPAAVPVPVTPAPRPLPAAARPWLPLAVAAGVLVAVAGGSFLFFNASADGGRGGYAHNTRPRAPLPAAHGATPAADEDALPPADGRLPSTPVEPEPPVVAHAGPPAPAPVPEAIPSPREVGPKDFFAAPPSPAAAPFDLIQVRLPVLVPVADLERDDVGGRVTAELAREPARLDLFARDTHRGLDVLLAAAKASGLALDVDAVARERHKRKLPTAFALYTEALTADEVRGLLAKLAAEDGKSGPRALHVLHMTPARDADQRELRELLGVDPGLWKRPTAPAADAGAPKPVSAGTAAQVASALTRAAGKPGIVLTYLPGMSRVSPGMSAEVRSYLAKRGDRKPAAVPVLIVLRPAG